MTKPLWHFDELVRASGGAADGASSQAVTGFSIDTRTLQPGNVFVALKDQRDGHEFVGTAFKRGAAAAIVAEGYQRQSDDGVLIRVANPLAALENIGLAARARLSSTARVIAVTGSAGKTGTKEMLSACLAKAGRVHASEKSYNNHWGVPLTLARMPAETDFGVFEIGMNHAGEITPLSKFVRPHVAIITTVEAVHLGQFASVETIADAKAEILAGVVPGGIAILNADNPHFARIAASAQAAGVCIVSFGLGEGAKVRPEKFSAGEEGSDITVPLGEKSWTFGVSIPGRHIAMNALAVAAALRSVVTDDARFAAILAEMQNLTPPEGRGSRTTLTAPGGDILLIDESYNANPASMHAALETLGTVDRARYPRRIVVLGDMLELGSEAGALHLELQRTIENAGADLVFAAGSNMKLLYDVIGPEQQGAWAETANVLEGPVLSVLRGGDVVMIKGSNGSRLAPIVAAVKTKFENKV